MDKTPEFYRAKASECRNAVARSPTSAGRSMLLLWAKGFERTASVLESKRTAFEDFCAQSKRLAAERSSSR
ncbi:MAG: hypothetical protein EXQ95_09960 [Alphaproteobacteria bacterium]|nr:hypothetical protein [Alphaproteobacteria bacterium]